MESHPLIGDREPLASLGAEYAAGSLVFRQKIAKLGAAYGAIRRTRGDGNCFFRWGVGGETATPSSGVCVGGDGNSFFR